MKVHEIEEERFKNESFSFNSKIPHTLLSKYCPLSPKDKSYMEETFEKLSLSIDPGISQDPSGRPHHFGYGRVFKLMVHGTYIGRLVVD